MSSRTAAARIVGAIAGSTQPRSTATRPRAPTDEVGGTFAHTLGVGPLTFRHIPEGGDGEIAGHLHPSARVSVRGRTIARRCFAADAAHMVMPAFGAYTGGLSIRDRAFAAVFGARDFTAHVLGQRRIYTFPAASCV